MKPKLKNWEYVVLTSLLIISFLFRFYNLRQLFQFSLDEEFWSYLIQRIIVYKDIPLIGGEISSTKIFTGPLYVYFHVPFYLVSKLHPLIGGYFWSAIGVVTTFLVYFFTKKYFSKLAAIPSSFLYASSFMMALYDRRFWNVSPIPIVSIISLWFLLKALNKKTHYLIPLSLILTFGIHSHFSSIAIFLACTVTWLIQTRHKKSSKKQRKHVFLAVGLFLFLNLVPTTLFDLRHDFWHVKAAKELITSFTQPKKPDSNADFSGIITNFSRSFGSLIYLSSNIDVADEMSHCQPIIDARPKAPIWAQMIGLFVIGFMIIHTLKNKHKPLSQFLAILLTVNLLGLFVYRERVFTYHFAALMPFFFIYLSLALTAISKKTHLLTIPLTVVTLLVINTQSLLNAKSDLSFTTKEDIAAIIIDQTQNQNVSINFLPSCEQYGFRYIFTVFKKPIAKSWVDPILGWLYPEETNQSINTYVNIAVEDEGATPTFYAQLNLLKNQAHTTVNYQNKVTIFFSFSPLQTDNNKTFY